MSTYAQIIEWVKDNHERSVAPCWVSECKAIAMKWPHPDKNRDGSERKKQAKQPLTNDMKTMIFEAFNVLGVPNGKRT